MSLQKKSVDGVFVLGFFAHAHAIAGQFAERHALWNMTMMFRMSDPLCPVNSRMAGKQIADYASDRGIGADCGSE